MLQCVFMCEQAYGGSGLAQRFQRLGYDVKTTVVVSMLAVFFGQLIFTVVSIY